MNSKKTKKVISTGTKVVLGIVASRIITNQIGFLNTNPTVKTAAKVVGSVFAGGMFGPEIAAGIMADGLIDGVQTFAPSVSTQLGIGGVNYLPAGGSTSVHSVSGGSYPNIRVD